MTKSHSLLEYILARVEYDPATECWNFCGPIDEAGYGTTSHFAKKYGTRRAHRTSYTAFYGPIPKGAHILHSCDNRRCVSPHHLRAGTAQDNVNDREARGRGRRLLGDDCPHKVLTEDRVCDARDDRRAGATIAYLAALHGVGYATMQNALCGATWRHVEDCPPVVSPRSRYRALRALEGL